MFNLVRISAAVFISATLWGSMGNAYGTFSGGRESTRGGARPVPSVPALTCTLRSPSRDAFSIQTSATDAAAKSSAVIFRSGPSDVPVKFAEFSSTWTSGGNDFTLMNNKFLLRVFMSTDDPQGRLYAAFEFNDSGDMLLLWCSPR